MNNAFLLFRKRPAFTLAEVLTTLGIIGIVAAMTLPNIITNYQKKVTVERLKKIYAIMQNAYLRSQNDNGPAEYWDYPQKSYDKDIDKFFQKYYKPYLNVAKECHDTVCIGNKNAAYSPVSLNGTPLSSATVVQYFVVLSDGTLLYFLPGVPASYIWMYIDINGSQKPNMIGRDIFVTDIYRYHNYKYEIKFWNNSSYDDINKLLGTQDYGCNKKVSGYTAGFNCGAVIYKSGWKIPPNYPW